MPRRSILSAAERDSLLTLPDAKDVMSSSFLASNIMPSM